MPIFFWIAFRNNILAVLVTVPGQLVLGLIVAVLIHNLKTGKNVYKVLLYIAVICDWVVFCNIIDYIFQPDEGSLVNYCLTTIGILKRAGSMVEEYMDRKLCYLDLLNLEGLWLGYDHLHRRSSWNPIRSV